jgi:hypothetical protein
MNPNLQGEKNKKRKNIGNLPDLCTLIPLDFAHTGNVSGSITTMATKLLLKLSPA